MEYYPPVVSFSDEEQTDLRAGRATEFETLAVALLPSLTRRARRLSPAAADDLVQEALLRAWVRFGSYEPGTNAGAWLGRILTLVWLEDCRRSRRLAASAPDDVWTSPTALDPAVSMTVRESVRQLPMALRSVLWLVDGEDQTYREAAQALGLPLGTVMSRLHRGRKAIRAALSSGARRDDHM